MGYIKKNMKYSTNEKEMKEEFEVLLNKNQEIYNNQQICNLIAKVLNVLCYFLRND